MFWLLAVQHLPFYVAIQQRKNDSVLEVCLAQDAQTALELGKFCLCKMVYCDIALQVIIYNPTSP